MMMKKIITISSVVLSVLALMAIPAAAGMLFDGTGDPTESGLEAINTPNDWQFDTPSVGFLYQAPTTDDGGYGLDDIDNGAPDVAAAELDASQGYFVEWRVDLTSSSDGAGWPGYNIGSFAWIEDSSGQHMTFHGDENNTDASMNFSWYTGWDDPNPVGTVDMSGDFHTLRFENPGGNAGTFDFFFDGNQILDDQPMGSGGGNDQARLMLGNGGASSVGEAIFDYIAINQEADPGAWPPGDDLGIFWKKNISGDWNTADNWTGIGRPASFNQSAVLGDVIESTQLVYTNTDVTVNDVQFNDASTYIVGGGGVINLAAGTSSGLPVSGVSALQGSHQFQAAVALHNNVTADVASGSSIEFNNRLFLNGNTLTKTGDGVLAISNDVVLADGTINVQQGTIAGNGTVGGDVINDGGTISPGDSGSVNSAIPEPSTLLMLVLGGLLVARVWRW